MSAAPGWRASPARLNHTRRAILHESHTFPLRNQQGRSLYCEGEIENHLDPLLRQDTELTPWQGIRHQWKHRDSVLVWPLASVLCMAVLLGLVALLHLLYPAS